MSMDMIEIMFDLRKHRFKMQRIFKYILQMCVSDDRMYKICRICLIVYSYFNFYLFKMDHVQIRVSKMYSFIK